MPVLWDSFGITDIKEKYTVFNFETIIIYEQISKL